MAELRIEAGAAVAAEVLALMQEFGLLPGAREGGRRVA
jgi:hypothetical protein